MLQCQAATPLRRNSRRELSHMTASVAASQNTWETCAQMFAYSYNAKCNNNSSTPDRWRTNVQRSVTLIVIRYSNTHDRWRMGGQEQDPRPTQETTASARHQEPACLARAGCPQNDKRTHIVIERQGGTCEAKGLRKRSHRLNLWYLPLIALPLGLRYPATSA